MISRKFHRSKLPELVYHTVVAIQEPTTFGKFHLRLILQRMTRTVSSSETESEAFTYTNSYANSLIKLTLFQALTTEKILKNSGTNYLAHFEVEDRNPATLNS